MLHRRDLYRLGTIVLGSAFSLALAIPGIRFFVDPLTKRGEDGDFRFLTRLGQLKVGEPQSFSILAERQDGWVRYPRQPVGSVWLIRQPETAKEPVIALSSECPHLSCPVALASGGKSFLCPCHDSVFNLDGTRKNAVSPRSMDQLEVRLIGDDDPRIEVKFLRFRPQSQEKTPLA
ncbi:ubiquinol-cytochrome c reductase iron-sulfur subunit [Tundrisphaera sp. TA3]|uniref:QcrA and Rieske domain-containing protein n=1 Tax=Tundrisphaera sp. TA3 TaxID=3435775 RepID=UPI003EBF0F2E